MANVIKALKLTGTFLGASFNVSITEADAETLAIRGTANDAPVDLRVRFNGHDLLTVSGEALGHECRVHTSKP